MWFFGQEKTRGKKTGVDISFLASHEGAGEPAAKPATPSPEERKFLGAEKVGTPVREIRDAITRLSEMEQYQHIHYEAVDFYCDRFLCGELISLVDESWDMEQLAGADPNMVKVAFIMLLRDMMQAYRDQIVIAGGKEGLEVLGVEQFIAGLLYETQSPMQPYLDWLTAVESQEEEDSAMLVMGLAQQLCVDPNTLYTYQMAIRDVIVEDILT